MTVVAHVTDLHLVEYDHHKRAGAAKSRLLYLNTGRKIDPKARFDRVCEALRRASRSDHLVITGDLTEDGTDAQFELLAAALAEANVDPEHVTLVPGNHDLYADRCADRCTRMRRPARWANRSSWRARWWSRSARRWHIGCGSPPAP